MKLLNGKVEIRPLPLLTPPAERTDPLARILTPGGELAVLADGLTPILHLGCVELKTGCVRGNHYHRQRHERFYVISGETTLFLEDLATGQTARATLVTGDFALIPPNIAHAFLPTTNGFALEYAPEPFDPTDTIRIDPLQSSVPYP
jgi:quercetin dioxygenase-like cupin family protein